MLTLIYLFAIPISVADLASFRIPNIYNKILGYGTCVTALVNGIGCLSDLAIYIGLLSLLYLLGIGMGDIKLLLIIGIALNSNSDINSFMFFNYLFVCASVHVVISYLAFGAFQEKIAMAPSIFLGLSAYLVTSG